MSSPLIYHGGNLHEAVRRFGIPKADWLDLSTGINPHPYPVRMPEPSIWQRLPEPDDGLAELAARYAGVGVHGTIVLPVPGSQAAIRALPALLRPGRVALAELSYGEYAPAFKRAGHSVEYFTYDAAIANTASDTHATPHQVDHIWSLADAIDSGRLPDTLDYLVIVKPNNPTCDLIAPATLLAWRDQLTARGGALIVDEAFIETSPTNSIAAHGGEPGLIVLRSIGKFYGLAGIRAGFVLGPRAFLDALDAELGAWALSGPARAAMHQALSDTRWQETMRGTLANGSAQLASLLMARGLATSVDTVHTSHGPQVPQVPQVRCTALFAWTPHVDAYEIHQHLAGRGIWTRFFNAPARGESGQPALPSIRFGLPATQIAFERLDCALLSAPHRLLPS